MYKINSVLNKPGIVRSTCFTPNNTINALSKHGSSRNAGRLMSTNGKKPSSIGPSAIIAVGGVLVGTTLVSKYNDDFRSSLEETVPYTKEAFNYLIPRKTAPIIGGEDISFLAPPLLPSDGEILDDDTRKADHLVVNIMDTPTPSSIDLELGKEKESSQVAGETPDDVLGPEEVPAENLLDAESHLSEDRPTHGHDIVEDIGEKVIDAAIDFVAEVIEDSVPGGETIVEIIEDIAELPTVAEKLEELEETLIESIEEMAIELGEDFAGFIETPLSFENKAEEVAAPSIEHLNTVLSVAHENLKIILDDTVTTKTSAAGMLHGYLTQFGQALLISKDDPAYKSVWEACEGLEHNVRESVELVKAKEAEAKLQMGKLQELIQDVRELGPNVIADKTESLISVSAENLNWGENQMKSANQKLKFLHDFQKRVDGSVEKLKVYLDGFTPDLIKLLQLEKFVEEQDLSNEDALLMLSLKRPELIYEEVQKKEEELKKEFELSLEKQKTDILKQAEQHLNNALEFLEMNKDAETKQKLEDLMEFHANHLQEELTALAEAHDVKLVTEIEKHGSELKAKHEREMTEKIDIMTEEHNFNVSKNESSISGIKSKISEVVDLNLQQHHSQNLWFAVQTLSSLLSNASENGRTQSLSTTLKDVKEMTKEDEVFSAIIDSIPQGAAESGVIPEDILVQRFSAVKRSCMRVATVKDGSVLSYAFSYIKSFFVISSYFQQHIDAEIDITKIGPYEILEKADFYLQQGDLVQAAKFMSLLNGVPRKLCADWLNEVLLLLETKQSVNLLLGYAGSFIAESN